MLNFKELEEKVLAEWREKRVFEQSMAQRKDAPHFVFYEGPPTANGRPGIHHVLARAYKDIICRYKTMAGFFVARKAGWDTHGLPVELEAEKQLGLRSKKDIEQYGIAAFNKKCKESVWTYKDEWEKLTERMGYWVDMRRPYITYDPKYMETLWWIIKQIWERKDEKGNRFLYQGHKVVPYCTRCGTGLSSHEVAQGYKSVTENSVYVKFKLKPRQKIGQDFVTDDHTYILSWTTTPWTLPGNVALAVGEDIVYAALRVEGINELHIVALDLVNIVYKDQKVEIVYDGIRGKDLVGLSYEPLFDIPSLQKNTAYKVYAADFVTTTDGAGVVHTAVMYGEDDYNLGIKVGLPQFHTVDVNGKFIDEVEGLEGVYVKAKETEEKIFSHLKEKGFFLRSEPYTHDYPFCWRCQTPLLYYAKPSWFIAMSKLRDALIENNSQVNWVPEHMKEGRFGEWLREVKDWNFSRERYWGTPLPIWTCETCGAQDCVGSVEELANRTYEKSGNTYFIMRHAQATSNLPPRIISHDVEEDKANPVELTEKGRGQARAAVQEIKNLGITRIISSDFTRTRQTAEIVAKELGLAVEFDPRLRELDHGHGFHGKTVEEYLASYELETSSLNRFTQKPESGGETLNEVRARMIGVVAELDKKYKNEKLLIVSHGDPLWMLEVATLLKTDEEEMKTHRDKTYINNAEVRTIAFKNLPYDEEGFLNLHRPYIDSFALRCAADGCDGKMIRIKELADVWFDSGCMPFAQDHFPFALKENESWEIQNPKSKIQNMQGLDINLNPKSYKLSAISLPEFPADYIAEAIDQTRGWFYTLLAVSTLLEKGAPYKNVISLAHVLDGKGQKMSKSRGNVVNPWDVIEKHGVDALRWYFFTVNDPGDYKLFEEKAVVERLRGFLGTFWNCVVFYKTYNTQQTTDDKKQIADSTLRPSSGQGLQITEKTHILDHWILSLLQLLAKDVRARLEAYDVTGSARAIERFVINDLSQWYVQSSRDRLQEDPEAMDVFGRVLEGVTRLSAPFIPFISDAIWSEINGSESVHLADYPKGEDMIPEEDTGLLGAMSFTREEVAKGLALRAEAKIKVRQPLASYTVAEAESPYGKPRDLALVDILKDKLNVKEIYFGQNLALDTTITEELKLEGAARDLIRQIQNARKEAGLKPGEEISLTVGDEEIKKLLEHEIFSQQIKTKTFVKEVKFESSVLLSVERI